MAHLPLKILVVCTGNSARSIIGEALFNAQPKERMRAFSAGAAPTGRVNPLALETLSAHGLATAGYASKSWSDFSRDDGPSLDLMVTVCDSAANEPCPYIPGAPAAVHWGVPDPAGIDQLDDARAAFEDVFTTFSARVAAAAALPLGDLDLAEIRTEFARIADEIPHVPSRAGA
ncbi:MAG: arsenate reductase ArsC [Pseudomonadota bacterium]